MQAYQQFAVFCQQGFDGGNKWNGWLCYGYLDSATWLFEY